MPDTTEHALAKGTLSYLIKPITPEVVSAAIRQLQLSGEATVVIVDDDPDAVRLLETMLMPFPRPFRILKAYDGSQALEIMEEVIPDVVFLDLLMPGMDGMQTIAKMRADERLGNVPVIVVSAKDPSDRITALGMPINIWCKGPLEISRGVNCLIALLNTLIPRYLPDPDTSRSFAQALPV